MKSVVILDSVKNNYIENPALEIEILKDVANVELCLVNGEEEINDSFFESDAIISWHTVPLQVATISKLKKCQGIVRAAVGYDNIDLKAATKMGVPISIVPDYGTQEVADHTMALLLALIRNIKTTDLHANQPAWDWRSIKSAKRIKGMSLGIIGFGRIGQAVTQRAKAFGIEVGFYDPYKTRGIDKVFDVTRYESLEDLLKNSEAISIHVPLSAETHHLISTAELNLLRDDAIIINTARGSVIDEKALINFIQQKPEIKLGLDVLQNEPHVPQELLASGNTILTCHSAFYSDKSILDLRAKAAMIVKNLLTKRELINVVNPSENFKPILNHYYDEKGQKYIM